MTGKKVACRSGTDFSVPPKPKIRSASARLLYDTSRPFHSYCGCTAFVHKKIVCKGCFRCFFHVPSTFLTHGPRAFLTRALRVPHMFLARSTRCPYKFLTFLAHSLHVPHQFLTNTDIFSHFSHAFVTRSSHKSFIHVLQQVPHNPYTILRPFCCIIAEICKASQGYTRSRSFSNITKFFQYFRCSPPSGQKVQITDLQPNPA